MPEPMPGDATYSIGVAADRMYQRLPAVYRNLDARTGYQLKRYMASVFGFWSEADVMTDRLAGNRPVGPASPEPWDLPADELARWRAARTDVNSALTDPDLADASWLPWLAQMLGAVLDPASGLQERRDTLRDATSGFRGGTQMAIANAARSALTGSRYVQVQPGLRGDGTTGTIWDLTLRTRASETPDPSIVLPTVIRKGAKPAGVQLWHATFGTPWDKIESVFPTWTDWDAHTWGEQEESGATYAVPENLAPGPSFENAADVAKWSPVAEGGGSVATWALASSVGVDGANAGRLTKVGATGGMRLRSAVITDSRILQLRDFLDAVTLKPSAAVPCSLVVNWQTSAGAAISSTTVALGTLAAGQWNRSNTTTRHTSPANAARATLDIVFTGTVAAGVEVLVDAALFRIVSAAGG